MRATTLLLASNNVRQRSIKDFWSCKLGNQKVALSLLYIIPVVAAFMGKGQATQSLPHLENVCHRSVNNSWFGKYSNCRVIWSLLDILNLLAAIIGNIECDMLTAPCLK